MEKLEIYIRSIREKEGLTTRELARLTGVSKSEINLIETGRAMPSLLAICRLARALNVDLKETYRYTY